MTERHNARRLGNMIPMLLFVLLFVLLCGVLAAVFMRSAQISAYAGYRNDAVQLCRNQAERFRSGEMLAEGRYYYNSDFTQTDAEQGEYLLDLSYSEDNGLVYAHISAYTADELPVFNLDVARYAPRR